MTYLFTELECWSPALYFAMVWHSPSIVSTYLYGSWLATCVRLIDCVVVCWMWYILMICCFAMASSAFLCVGCCSILGFMDLASQCAISIDFATVVTLVRSMSF